MFWVPPKLFGISCIWNYVKCEKFCKTIFVNFSAINDLLKTMISQRHRSRVWRQAGQNNRRPTCIANRNPSSVSLQLSTTEDKEFFRICLQKAIKTWSQAVTTSYHSIMHWRGRGINGIQRNPDSRPCKCECEFKCECQCNSKYECECKCECQRGIQCLEGWTAFGCFPTSVWNSLQHDLWKNVFYFRSVSGSGHGRRHGFTWKEPWKTNITCLTISRINGKTVEEIYERCLKCAKKSRATETPSHRSDVSAPGKVLSSLLSLLLMITFISFIHSFVHSFIHFFHSARFHYYSTTWSIALPIKVQRRGANENSE